jgi:hypothetical protein
MLLCIYYELLLLRQPQHHPICFGTTATAPPCCRCRNRLRPRRHQWGQGGRRRSHGCSHRSPDRGTGPASSSIYIGVEASTVMETMTATEMAATGHPPSDSPLAVHRHPEQTGAREGKRPKGGVGGDNAQGWERAVMLALLAGMEATRTIQLATARARTWVGAATMTMVRRTMPGKPRCDGSNRLNQGSSLVSPTPLGPHEQGVT